MKLLIFTIISALTISCATQKQTTRITNNFTEIKFGKIGGFTGLENQYLIKNDGSVFKNSGDSLILLNQIDQPLITHLNKQLLDLKFNEIVFTEKGNMTYYIEITTPKYKNKVTWTSMSQANNLKELYKTLVKTLKK